MALHRYYKDSDAAEAILDYLTEKEPMLRIAQHGPFRPWADRLHKQGLIGMDAPENGLVVLRRLPLDQQHRGFSAWRQERATRRSTLIGMNNESRRRAQVGT